MNVTLLRDGTPGRQLITAIAIATLTMLLVGCPATKEPSPSAISGHVRVRGSNTFGEELAPRLIAEYRRTRTNVAINLESKGSGSGFAALLAGECDVAAASRAPTNQELAEFRARGMELNDYLIGYYGVAVIVNASNSVDSLTKDQVKAIFTGAARNWKEVGGPDSAIHVYIRDPVSGTNLGFRELATDTRPYAKEAKQFTSYHELAEAVGRDAGGVGYSSMRLQAKGVRSVRIGRTEANYLTVNEGWYPYARTLHLYTNKATETPAARDFAQFVQRDPGQKILEDLGFVRRFEKRLRSAVPD